MTAGIIRPAVLPCRLQWRQVGFATPAPRTAFEHMSVMQEAIEHGADRGRVLTTQFRVNENVRINEGSLVLGPATVY